MEEDKKPYRVGEFVTDVGNKPVFETLAAEAEALEAKINELSSGGYKFLMLLVARADRTVDTNGRQFEDGLQIIMERVCPPPGHPPYMQ